MARENELLLSYLIDKSTTFLISECGETSPDLDTLGLRPMPFRPNSTIAVCSKSRGHDCSTDCKYRCCKCLDTSTVLKATISSTCGRQPLGVPPSPCKVMNGSKGVLKAFILQSLSLNFVPRIMLDMVGLLFSAVTMVFRGFAEWSYSLVLLIL